MTSTTTQLEKKNGKAVLELEKLSKSFGSLRIINGVDLAIAEGERHGLIGPNGAGKSTLFNLISGNLAPTSGEIRLRGQRISKKPAHHISRLAISRSFQITNLFPNLSVLENISIGLMGKYNVRLGLFRRVSSMHAINSEAEQLVHDFNLDHRKHDPAVNLAYSEQRALEIAVTVATSPSVILLDEPTAGMSQQETEHMIALIRRTAAGRTLLIVEHDLDVVFELCDRISVLVYGSVLATGTPDEVRSNIEVQRAYLGEDIH